MKRTLSAILALCMLVAMLPTFSIVSAAEAGSFEVDFRTITAAGLDSNKVKSTATGANWSIIAAESTMKFNGDLKFGGDNAPFFDFQTWSPGAKLTVEFTVPADGKYQVDVYGMRRDAGGLGKFYIDGDLIGEEDFYDKTLDYLNAVKGELSAIELTAGTHKLMIESAAVTSGKYALLLVQRLSFAPVAKSEYFAVDFRTGDTSTMTPTEGWNTDAAVPGATRYPNYLATSKGDGWSVDSANSTIAEGKTGSYFEIYSSFATWTPSNSYITFDFEVEGDGAAYDITAYGMHRPEGGYINYFIDGVFIGKFDCQSEKADYVNSTSTELRPMTLSGGTHKLTLFAEKGASYGVMLPVKVTFEKTASLTKISNVEIECEKTELEKDDTANISGSIRFENNAGIELRKSKFNTGNAPLDGSVDTTLNITYKSSDEKVATVSENGVITAVGGGSTAVTATVEAGGVSVTSNSITVTVKDNSVPATITFAADSVGDVALSIDGAPQSYKKLSPVQIERGSLICVEASDVEGKKFVGWVRGSADYGRIVSVDAEYEFTAATHTMLTAVYADIPEDSAAVEYYNENGQYIETKAAAEGKPANNPTLVGYVFSDWWIAKDTPLVLENVTALTRAVAKFAKQAGTFSVTVPTSGVTGSASGEYAYDDEITLTSASGDVYWLRGGKVVDFGSTYTFNVWDDTVITIATSGDNAPKVVLDSVVKDDAYMIEYDSGDKTIVEVGIIFGESDAITVASCSEKMNSQRNLSHGQFTAQSDCSYAKGYLIYKDGGEYKVIYSE